MFPRNRLTVILILIFLPVSVLASREERGYADALTVNPVGLIFGLMDGQFEMRLNSQSSMALRGSYWGINIGGWNIAAYGGGLAYRWYLHRPALKGLYLSPVLQAASFSANYKDLYQNTASLSALAIAPGLEAGQQWIWGGVVADLGAGLYYYTGGGGSVTVNGTSVPLSYFSGLTYGLRLGLGFAWGKAPIPREQPEADGESQDNAQTETTPGDDNTEVLPTFGDYIAPATLGTFEQGIEYFRRKLYEKAKPLFEKASQDDPDNPRVWAYLGETYYDLGQESDAVEAYKHYLKLKPDSPDLSDWLEQQKNKPR